MPVLRAKRRPAHGCHTTYHTWVEPGGFHHSALPLTHCSSTTRCYRDGDSTPPLHTRTPLPTLPATQLHTHTHDYTHTGPPHSSHTCPLVGCAWRSEGHGRTHLCPAVDHTLLHTPQPSRAHDQVTVEQAVAGGGLGDSVPGRYGEKKVTLGMPVTGVVG